MLELLYDLPVNLAILVFLLGCVALDLLFGDPKDWPHPVRVLGKMLDILEGWVRASGLPLRSGGQIALGVMIASTAGVVYVLSSLPLIGEMAALYLGYAGLALGCLLRECGIVMRLLDSEQLEQARVHLAGLVSRDTREMTTADAWRALGETLAENFNDGFVCPFFWLALLGPIALWSYKAVSTMDSMWGYRTERFEELGKAGAKADDVLAWIPARLSAIYIWLAGALFFRPSSWSAVVRDAGTMESPNAGWPMSAAAHVVRASMGGPTCYFGVVKDKPVLGPANQAWSSQKIRLLRRVLILAAVLHTLVLGAVGSWLEWWTLL